MDNPRILQITGELTAGSARHVVDLVVGLLSKDVQVHLAWAPGGRLDREVFSIPGLHLHPLNLGHHGGVVRNLRALREVRALITDIQPEIIHTHTSVAGAVGRLAASFVPRTSRPRRLHMLHAIGSHSDVPLRARLPLRGVELILRAFTDEWISGSAATLRRAHGMRIVPRNRGVVIPYSVDTDQLAKRVDAARVSDSLRQELHLDESVFVCIFVGRLDEQKDPLALLRIFERARASTSDQLHLVIVGDGPLREDCESFIQAHGLGASVTLLGWRDDVQELLARGADLLLLTSRWEAFGIVNLEAHMAEVPVLAYSTEGIPEVVQHGDTGVLTRPGDEPAFARELVRLATVGRSEAHRLGQAGRHRAVSHFDTSRMVDDHLKLYSDQLDR